MTPAISSRRRSKKSKHLYRVLNAWGIDAQYFTDVLASRGSIIMINDTEEKKRYLTSAEIVEKHGQFKHHKPHRAQIFLPLRYWVQTGDILSADRIKEVLRDKHVGV